MNTPDKQVNLITLYDVLGHSFLFVAFLTYSLTVNHWSVALSMIGLLFIAMYFSFVSVFINLCLNGGEIKQLPDRIKLCCRVLSVVSFVLLFTLTIIHGYGYLYV